MRKFLYLSAVFLGSFALWIGFWIGAFALVHLGKGDSQVTPFYGFTSGPGPMIETAVFGATILGTMWHNLNCHEATCWRIGRHKVNGTPYCNLHHEAARPEETELDILRDIRSQLSELIGQGRA